MKNENVYTHDIPKFRKRIEQLRGDTPQKEFCDGIGVSVRTYQNWVNPLYKGYNGKTSYTLPNIETAIRICDKYGVSLDYLTGREDFTHAGNKDMSNFTGLSDTAIECLRGWYQDRQQAGFLHQYSNDTETLNTILEYYGNIRKQNKKKGLINGFSLFHFIGNFFNAHNFKRVQQDLVRYGNGSHFNKIEVGDTITKKDTGTSEVIEHLCTPISSGSFRGEDTTKLDIYNTENESEQYYIELSDIYREHCKSQIINILKKIGGIQ